MELHDQTDGHNELVHERQWLLHPAEPLSLRGNLFIVHDVLNGRGWVLLKVAPLPHARGRTAEWDLKVTPVADGFSLRLCDDDGYPWQTGMYEGGVLARTRLVHRFQRMAGRIEPRFVVNTWGDRNRDSRINEAFLMGEVEAASRLGADVLQIDDGWQRGRTANSAEAERVGGVWEGFYAADEGFWTPDPERFPRGLSPVVDRGAQLGIEIGLWFAPDSSQHFANWSRDAQTLLRLHRDYGIRNFKLDSIDMRHAEGERRVEQMMEAVLEGSGGRVVLDLDVTAGRRPGYFGAMEAGPIFVENRYTDWHRYWPHATLRVLWHLARWVDPARLRIEFLNHARNPHLYQDDPLAPSEYSPAYLFATTMFAQPLGWFESCNLPSTYAEQLPPLVDVWRAHREDISDGTVIPIGQPPDGTGWTGLISVSQDGERAWVLLFRELNERADATFELPTQPGVLRCVELLYQPDGASAALDGSSLRVHLPEPRQFLFAMLSAGS